MPNQQLEELLTSASNLVEKRFLLTSSRHLTRILDQGLIGPDLVMMDEAGDPVFLNHKELNGLTGDIEGWPRVPVLLELDGSEPVTGQIMSVSAINCIHFTSQSALEDHLARGFENVPVGLFQWQATPSLFVQDTAQSGNSEWYLPKLNRAALFEKYRQLDALAGAIFCLINKTQKASVLQELLESAANCNSNENINSVLVRYVIEQLLAHDCSNDAVQTLQAYQHLLVSYDVDEGWPRAQVLQQLNNALSEDVASSQLIAAWLDFSSKVISNQRDMVSLTDEKQISLRAILLHILNPRHEELERIAKSGFLLGENVKSVAYFLASTLNGIAAMSAEDKERFSGLFFFVCDLLAASTNGTNLSFKQLQYEPCDGTTNIHWRGKLLANVSSVEPVAPTVEEDISEETDLPETEELMLQEPLTLESLATAISESTLVSKTSIESQTVVITLQKSAAKLPRSARFSASIIAGQCVFTSRILDMNVTVQAKKLTLRKLRATLSYQAEKPQGFRFELNEEPAFNVTQSLVLELPDKAQIDNVLEELIKAQVWFKEL